MAVDGLPSWERPLPDEAARLLGRQPQHVGLQRVWRLCV